LVITIREYNNLDDITDSQIHILASKFPDSLDIELQEGSYDLGGHPLHYSIDLTRNLVRLSYKSELRNLDENNQSAKFSGGSFYGYYSYMIAVDFRVIQIIMNGIICVRHHHGEKFHCREYVDIIVGSW
jgi:hypothetical protein